jgi:Uma2 family endonuclease
LAATLHAYLESNRVGWVLMSPADIELRPESIMQPDVFVVPFVPDRAPGEMSWKDVGALVLAIEVISPSSVRTDRVEKRDFYMSSGVEEYWVLDLDARHIERWTGLRDTPQVETAKLEWRPAGARTSLVIDLPGLFARIGIPRVL